MYYEKLKSKNISLCSINLNDSEMYYEWKNKDNKDNEIIFGSYKEGKLENVESAKEELNKMAIDNAFAIVNNNKMIGLIGFSNILQANQRTNIWIKMNPELDLDKQINYGAEALDTLIKYSYDIMNLNSIIVDVPSFNNQTLEILKNSKMSYLGSRTNSEYYKNDEYYDNIYYQIIRRDYENGTKTDGSIKHDLKKIVLPNELSLSKKLEGNNIQLEKCEETNDEYVSTMAMYLNNGALSIPIGEYKTNWNDYRSNKHLTNVDYLIKKDNELLGYVNLFRKNKRNHTADLEIMISEAYQGRGYGKEAMLLLLKEAFTNGNYVNILSSIFEFNETSINMHEQIGFTKIGERKEAYYAYGKLNNMNLYQMTLDNYNKIKIKK